MADLRLALQRAEQQAARKEDYLRQEIGELQQVLEQIDDANLYLQEGLLKTENEMLA